MNHITTSNKETNLIRLTPFKICLCNLIYKFTIEDKDISDKSGNNYSVSKFAIMTLLFYDSYQSEISKKHFLAKLDEKVALIGINEELKDVLAFELKENINSFISGIKGIDDLYTFFKGRISLITKVDEGSIPFFSKGGFIDNFLRKCLNAFNKLGFEELSQLYQSLNKYNNEDLIEIVLSDNENERLFEKCFDNKMLLKNIKNNVLNFQQKCFFVSDNKATNSNKGSEYSNKEGINDKLFNLHKFFDYNLHKISNDENSSNPTFPSPNNDSKIHHSLLALVNFYFDQKCFDKAIQILFECIKLSQSNCDHEALLKCFLWMTKVFIYTGKYSLASQCLSTCLIKSFQNNYHLIHLLSSVELANLNYMFNANIGESPASLDEKILSHSKNYIQLYKNILEYFTLNQEGENNDLDKLLHYALCHLILGLLEKGEFSLAVNYLTNISTRMLFNKANSAETSEKPLENEILLSFGMFAVALEEYSPKFAFDLFNEIITTYSSLQTADLSGILQLFIKKYLTEYCGNKVYINTKSTKEMGIFYEFQLEYYDLLSLYEKQTITVDLEKKLLSYIKQCDIYHFLRYKMKALILLSKLYLCRGKTTEATVISKKLMTESNNRYDKMITMIALGYCDYQMNHLNECSKSLSQIEDSIEKIGCLADKFDFYYLKIHYIKQKKEALPELENLIKLCLTNAILLNNKNKIKKAIYLLSKYDQYAPMIQDLNSNLLQANSKLFILIGKYPIKLIEVFNVVMLINQNNLEFINKWFRY